MRVKVQALAGLLFVLSACAGPAVVADDTTPAPVEEEAPAPGVVEGEVPADFPVPVYQGGTINTVLARADGTSVTASYPQSEFGPVRVFYGDFVSGKKIVLEASSEDPRASTWIVEDQGQTIHITVAESGGKTELVIAVINGTN